MARRAHSVLVVEDDTDLRDMVEITLSGAGYRVATAAEGREALERVAQEMPAVIVLDMKMPGMNGWEFAREFQARYDHAAPILVLTAAQSAEERAREIGAQGFLDKPFEIDALIRLVDAVLTPPGPQEHDDERLIAQARRGDQAAFITLYDRHYDRIYRYVAVRVSRVEDVEALTQQVFLKAWAQLGRYEHRGSPFPAWLLAIAAALVSRSYGEQHMARPVSPDAGSDRERLLRAIFQLPPLEQKVLTLRFFDQLDQRQVAMVVGQPEASVRLVQYRALHELRRILGEG